MIFFIIKKLIGFFLISVFGIILWHSITHENSIEAKFGETEYIEGTNGNPIPENIQREFNKQDEDMANLTVGVVSLVVIVLSTIFLILR